MRFNLFRFIILMKQQQKKIREICANQEHKNMRVVSQALVGWTQVQKLQVRHFSIGRHRNNI